MASVTFESFEDEADEWRRQRHHQIGNILADSGGGHSNRSGARNAIENLNGDAPATAVTES